MQIRDVFSARAELKFFDDEAPGTLGGLGAVFDNIDSHGDLIRPGAFANSLAQHKANGTKPRMYVEHSAFTGGDPLPVGVWDTIEEEGGGLRVKGRLIGLDHPDIKRVQMLAREGAIGGLSIAFNTPDGGATFGKKAGEPKRTLNRIDLVAIDLVSDPSNPRARIDSVKSVMVAADHQAATQALVSLMHLHREALAGGNAPSSEQRAAMFGLMQTSHMALTGQAMPADMRSAFGTTIRDFEDWLHLPVEQGGRGFSNAKAREFGNLVFKSAPRDEGSGQAATFDKETVSEMGSLLAEFSLPSF